MTKSLSFVFRFNLKRAWNQVWSKCHLCLHIRSCALESTWLSAGETELLSYSKASSSTLPRKKRLAGSHCAGSGVAATASVTKPWVPLWLKRLHWDAACCRAPLPFANQPSFLPERSDFYPISWDSAAISISVCYKCKTSCAHLPDLIAWVRVCRRWLIYLNLREWLWLLELMWHLLSSWRC